MNRAIQAATLAANLALGSAAHAITVSETTVGDFDSGNDPTLVTDTIGTLDFGVNTISGSIMAECIFSGPDLQCTDGSDPGDAFNLTIAPGEALLSVTLTTAGSAPAGYTIGFGMLDVPGFTFVHSDALAPFNATTPIIDGVPLGSGDYVFGLGQGLATTTGPASYDWTVTFNVGAAPAIPLPAGLSLLATAFGVAFALRRRSASRA